MFFLGPKFCSPLVVSVRVTMFGLNTLGSGHSEGVSGRRHIHPIWRTWRFHGGVYVYWLCQTGFFALRWRMITQVLSSTIVGSPPVICLQLLNVEECEPPISVSRLIGHSVFGDNVGRIKSVASNDIQEITFMGGCLVWKYAAVCGGRVRNNFF